MKQLLIILVATLYSLNIFSQSKEKLPDFSTFEIPFYYLKPNGKLEITWDKNIDYTSLIFNNLFETGPFEKKMYNEIYIFDNLVNLKQDSVFTLAYKFDKQNRLIWTQNDDVIKKGTYLIYRNDTIYYLYGEYRDNKDFSSLSKCTDYSILKNNKIAYTYRLENISFKQNTFYYTQTIENLFNNINYPSMSIITTKLNNEDSYKRDTAFFDYSFNDIVEISRKQKNANCTFTYSYLGQLIHYKETIIDTTFGKLNRSINVYYTLDKVDSIIINEFEESRYYKDSPIDTIYYNTILDATIIKRIKLL